METATIANLRLGLFSPSPILFAAHRDGTFAAAGIALSTERVSSSRAQFADLAAGRYDLVLTSPDNVLSYRYDDANLLGHRVDARVLRGVDRGMGLSLISQPARASLAGLAGARLGVDVAASGFALALFALLSRQGLERGRDYAVVELGATPRRLDALLEGACDATLLNAGFDLRAEEAGYRRLARLAREYPPYLGSVLATTSDQLARKRHGIERFLGAWDTARALLLGAPGEELLAQFATGQLGLGDDAGLRFARTARDPREGLVPDGALDWAAMETLASLRSPAGDSTLADALRNDANLIAS